MDIKKHLQHEGKVLRGKASEKVKKAYMKEEKAESAKTKALKKRC